jgi:hypothetical protein
VSDSERDRLSEEEKVQTKANLHLSAEFVKALISHPELFEDIPDNATIVFLPDDDPQLATSNMKIFDKLANGEIKAGGPVVRMRWPRFQGLATMGEEPISLVDNEREVAEE